jgi:hypothetical protein
MRELSGALSEAIDCWENPDSPEAFCFAMKHLMNLRDRLDEALGAAWSVAKAATKAHDSA